MNANSNGYAITASGPTIVILPTFTRVRKHVNGFVTSLAFSLFNERDVTLCVQEVRNGVVGRVLSYYSNASGTWKLQGGAEVLGLEGLDRAGIYQLRYPLEHVTRAYAENMAASL